jgi:hypothetical protein
MNEEDKTYREGDDVPPVDNDNGESGATPPAPLRPSTKDVTLDCGIVDPNGERLRDAVVSKLKGSDRKDIGTRDSLANGGKLISRLLFNRLDEVKGLNLSKPDEKDRVVRGMLSADRSRLMLEIYQLSKNVDFLTVTVNCGSCGAENEVDFKIHEFPFRPFRNYRLDPQKNLFVFDVETEVFGEKHKATFRFPNGYDEETTIPLLKKNPVEAGHLMLQRCVLAYDGNTMLPKTFIDDLDVDELDELSDGFQEALPGVELSPEMSCFDCGKEATVTVDIADFFFGKSSKVRRR